MSQPNRMSRMDAEAYAGFLKLWLTPGGRMPSPSPEVEAYVRHANRRDPVPAELCGLSPRAPRQAA